MKTITEQLMIEMAITLSRLSSGEITANHAIAASKIVAQFINLEANNMKRAVLLSNPDYKANYQEIESLKELSV